MREIIASLRRTHRPEWVLTAFLGMVVACRSAGAPEQRPSRCVRAEEPALKEPPKLDRIISHVSVEGSITTTRLKSELRKHVPTSLGRGEEDAGAPGRVTYAVERGPLQLALAEDRLVVSTNVTAQISVCKPIGGFCVSYGRCSPTLVSSASVPLVLDKNYEVGESRVSASITRGCRIAGFDVSSEVSRQAERAVAETKREIDRQRPRLAPWVSQGWALLAQPIALDAESCLRLAPEKVAQRRPRLEDGVLSTAALVAGTIELEQPCRDRAQPDGAGPLPPLEIVDTVAPESVLEVPYRLSWTEVGAALSRGLGATPDAPRVLSARAKGALVDGVPRLALALAVQGACGDGWFSAEPWYDPSARRVRLREVRTMDRARGGLSRRTAGELAQRLERDASIPLPFDPARADASVRAMLRDVVDRPAPGVAVELELSPAAGRVLVAPEGLVPVIGLRGRLAVRVAEAP